MKENLLFKDAIVVANPGAADGVFRGWLLVQDGVIHDFGKGATTQEALREIDCCGAPLFAGLVNAHAHSHSSINRGGTIGLGLDPWLAAVRAEQKVLTENDMYVAALATFAELLAGGVTSVLDMCVCPNVAIRAARELGIRIVVAPFCGDGIPFLPPLSATRAFLEGAPKSDGRVTFAVSVHDLESSSDKQIVEAFELAKKFDVPFHMHCAETPEWAERTRARTGVSPIVHLQNLGVLAPRTLLAHAIWLDDEDISILVRTGTGVVHCPASNLSIGSGVARVADMIERGVSVALGTDGAKATQRLDMFAAMRMTAFVQRGQKLRADVIHPNVGVEMSGANGAKHLMLRAGIIAKGAPADLALLRADRVHLQPMNPEVASTMLVQAAGPNDVRMTIVDGRVVYEDGALAFDDIVRIAHALGEVSDDVMDRVMKSNEGVAA